MTEEAAHAYAIRAAQDAANAAAETRLEMAKIIFQLTDVNKQLSVVQIEVAKLALDIDEINAAANRWKGGFLVIVAFGGVIGWLVSIMSNVGKFLK